MRKTSCLLFSFLVLLYVTLPAFGDAPTTAASLPSTNPAAVVQPPIRFSDVASQAEALAISLRQMRTEISSDPVTKAIQEQISDLGSEIDARLEETTRLVAANPSLQTLPALQADWQAIDRQLQEWKSSLAKQIDLLKRHKDSLTASENTWKQELQLARNSHANSEIVEHIQSALANIETTQSAIESALKQQIFPLARNVDDQDAKALDALASVQQARQEAFDRLIVRDSPPIWTLISHWPADQNPIRDTANSFITQLEGLRAYAVRARLEFVLHAFIFLALAGLLFWARRSVNKTIEKDPSLAGAEVAFESPLLTSIVLSLLASNWIYPQPPQLLWAIFGAAALIPTVIILRRLVERRLFPILDAMVAFYFLDQLRIVAASQQTTPRLLFLVEMGAGILFLGSFILGTKTSNSGAAAGDRFWKTIRIGARVALVVFTIALIANLLGYVGLANLIGDATLDSAYLAVILYAITRIAAGLLRIALRSWPLKFLSIVQRHEAMILARLVATIQIIALLIWLIGTLDMLAVRAVVFSAALRILTAQLTVGSINLSLGHLLLFIGTIWAAFFISRLLRFILEEDIYARFPVSGGISYAISRILHYVILMVGFFLALAALGYNLTNFTILAGAFGVGLGFGLQNIINNFVSGLILLFERPIKVGDLIQLEDATGIVQRIGIRASILRTTDSSEIIVPNGNILSSKVTNWTHSNSQRGIEISVGSPVDSDPKRVIELLKSVAAAHPSIARHPPPQAFLEKMGGDALTFRLRAWTSDAEKWAEVSSDLSVGITDAFAREKIALK